jgi:uncharacterized protein YegL
MKLKINHTKILFSITLSFLILSCSPKKPTTDFNVLIDVPSGDDVRLEAQEDEELIVEYSVEPFDESVDLKLMILEKPKFGNLKNCELIATYSMRCIYTPGKNFSGKDEIVFHTQDGDLRGKNTSKVMINIISTPDTPIARDGSFEAQSAKSVKFKFPTPVDPDSKSSDLSYEIVSLPQNGELVECRKNECIYKARGLFEGNDLITYRVIDNTNLVSNIASMNIVVSNILDKGIETFTQGVNSLKGVDIVWVIDNSGSMKDEQENLAKNFQSFIENFMDNGKAKFPFQMGILTTDKYLSSKSNLLEEDSFGVPYNLTSSRAESDFNGFKSDFDKAVNVGIGGSALEKCFDSIETQYKKNKKWFSGDDNLLVYIILTDEAEQSSGSIDSWSKYFLGLKNESYKTKLFPIVKIDTDNDKRFFTISKDTGTKLYDINGSFDRVLDDISLSVSQNLSSFSLRADIQIMPDSIRVSVDGNDISNFVYQDNKVKLLMAPAAYSTIVVTYKYGGY